MALWSWPMVFVKSVVNVPHGSSWQLHFALYRCYLYEEQQLTIFDKELLLAGSFHLSPRCRWKDRFWGSRKNACWLWDPRGNDVTSASERYQMLTNPSSVEGRNDTVGGTEGSLKTLGVTAPPHSLNQALVLWFHESHYFGGLWCIFLLVNEWPFLATAFL